MRESDRKLLSQIYYNVKNPASFSTANKLFSAAKLKSPTIRLQDVQKWLRSQITYTLHKPVRRRFKRNRIVVSRIGEQFQADLVDLQKLSRQNSGCKYILTAIDLFSKKAFAIPLKTKRANEVKAGFQEIFKFGVLEKVQTDQGKEFYNSEIKAYFAQLGVQ